MHVYLQANFIKQVLSFEVIIAITVIVVEYCCLLASHIPSSCISSLDLDQIIVDYYCFLEFRFVFNVQQFGSASHLFLIDIQLIIYPNQLVLVTVETKLFVILVTIHLRYALVQFVVSSVQVMNPCLFS